MTDSERHRQPAPRTRRARPDGSGTLNPAAPNERAGPARPFRLRVLDALTGVLEGIRRQDGYRHDMAGRVFRGRLYYGEDDPLPMLSILEAPRETAPLTAGPGSGAQKLSWPLAIQGTVGDDPVHPADPAHWLLADTRRALARARAAGMETWGVGPRLLDVRAGTGVVHPPNEVAGLTFFLCPVGIDMVENPEMTEE